VRAGRILVIDDSAFFRGLLAGMLEAEGHEVVDACGGQDISGLLDGEGRPDLVLLDLNLPERRGRRLLRQIRARFAPEELPVLALTEIVASDRDLERLSELGCAGALNKLAPPDHVRFRVRSALFPACEEARSRRRVALSLGVRFRLVGQAQCSRTHTVSPNGVFVRCSAPPPVGSEVELRLELGDPARTLLVGGEVVRVEDVADEASPRGFALQFTRITSADRAALAEVLDRVEETGL
jgi:uncharacterized protein (TIGR02266 family)